VDATGCPGPAQAEPAGCAASCAMATALLGIPGLLVTAVTAAQDGLDGSGGGHRPRLRSRAPLPEVRQDCDAGQGTAPDRAP